ncbi:MAG TPA: 16S rRNA (guanine(966)-N(2))-methyltransferase RsmD [Candidatus Saccharimonadales bacterium]|nr:16S rRNA (guanine(966)-N(2))-methyltransferase RsmD [Candidatus Saccharimonadales bacterium]
MRLRLIAGTLGGRFLDAPDTQTTHPMSERIRGSLFNILGDITGKTVLDAFAGSGALSFEAVSRGAKSALLLEKDKVAQKIIAKNIAALGVSERMQLIKANCRSWSEQNPEVTFDLILLDPPYHDLQLSTVSLLANHLNVNGLMVLSYPGRDSAPTVNGVVVVDNRSYGDAALAFYRQDRP